MFEQLLLKFFVSWIVACARYLRTWASPALVSSRTLTLLHCRSTRCGAWPPTLHDSTAVHEELRLGKQLFAKCEESALSNSGDLACAVGPFAEEKPESMVSPTDLKNTSNPLLANERVQGDLLLENKQRIDDLPEDDRMMKLCSDDGFMKTVAQDSIS